MGRYDEAETEARTAIAVRSDQPEAWNTLGLILLAKKQKEDAARAFETAIAIRPDFPDARANLARAER